jgi:4'-phosphopantetheinyl transferase
VRWRSLMQRARSRPASSMADVTRVFLFDLSRDEGRCARRLEILDDRELARRESFVREADRDCYTAAHVGLRLLLAAALGLSPAELSFGRRPCPVCEAPHGKPFLLGGHGLEWSMAHTSGLVAFALSPREVGIDLERSVTVDDLDLLDGALHPREREALARTPRRRRAAAFSQCWTRKEAYLKATGAGLGEAPETCFVGLGAKYGQAQTRVQDWWLGDLEVPAGYAGALAVRGPGAPVVVSSSFAPAAASRSKSAAISAAKGSWSMVM